jgi:plastocyanin
MTYRGLLGSRMLAGMLVGAYLVGASGPAQAAQRFFTIAAVEPKGGTSADKEPFPTAALPEGGGYVIKKPDQTGRWEVSAYVWQPSQIIVTEGDDVTLEFIGINGAEHPTTIVGYDKTLVLKRGHVIRIVLKADKPGTFAIVCNHHKPSMVGELIVMPKK